MNSNTTTGVWLTISGVTIAIGAFIHRASVMSDYEYGATVSRLVRGSSEPFNNTPYIIAGIVGALLFLAGVIFLATGNAAGSSEKGHRGDTPSDASL